MNTRQRTIRHLALAFAALTAAACSAKSTSTRSSNTTTKPGSSQSTTTTLGNATTIAGGPEVNAAGDISDYTQFKLYDHPSGKFAVKIPEGWGRSESGAVVTFTDKLNSVRMEPIAASQPTVSSAQQNEVPAIRAASKNYEPGKVSSVRRTSGTAILITYRADSEPNDVTGKVTHLDVERYEFWRDGTEVILTLSGPQGADNVDPWLTVTNSFVWK